jgi:hypothetical protein
MSMSRRAITTTAIGSGAFALGVAGTNFAGRLTSSPEPTVDDGPAGLKVVVDSTITESVDRPVSIGSTDVVELEIQALRGVVRYAIVPIGHGNQLATGRLEETEELDRRIEGPSSGGAYSLRIAGSDGFRANVRALVRRAV